MVEGTSEAKDRGYTGWMVTLFVVIVGMSAGSVWFGAEVVGIEGVTTVECAADGSVLVALDRKAYFLDPRGEIALVLERAVDGQPFEIISTVGIDGEGRLYVGDAERHRIDVFDREGRPVEAITNPEATGRHIFELLPLRDGGIAVADVVGNRIVWIGSDRSELKSMRRTSSPAGLIELPGGDLLYSERGGRHLHYATRDLKKKSPADRPEQPPWGEELPAMPFRHMRLMGDDAIVYVYCWTNSSECWVRRYTRTHEVTDLASLRHLRSVIEPANDTPEMGSVCPLPNGEVLFNSESHLGLWAVRGLEGGAPGPMGESIEELDEQNLVAGAWQELGPNSRLYRYGSHEFVGVTLEVLGRRIRARRLSDGMLVGLYILLVLLLGAYAFFRATGATGNDAQARALQRIPLVWQGLVLSDLRTPLAYFGVVIVTSGGVFGLTYLTASLVSAATLALATGLFVSRRVGTSLVTRFRSASHAETAFLSYLGPTGWLGTLVQPEEKIELAFYAAPSGRTMLDRALRDVLDILVPRIHLVVVTDRAVYAYPCSLFGSPMGRIYRADRSGELGKLEWSDETLRLRPEGWAEPLQFVTMSTDLPPSGSLLLGGVSIHCDDCLASIGSDRASSCTHQRQRPLLARLLGLFPGLGHLYLRDFRRGRALGFLSVAQAMDAYYWVAPWLMGTLHVSTRTLMVPSLSLAGIWVFSLIDLHRRLTREGIERSLSTPFVAGQAASAPSAIPRPPPPRQGAPRLFSAFVEHLLKRGVMPDQAVAMRRHLEEVFTRLEGRDPEQWGSDELRVHLEALRAEGMADSELKPRLETLRLFLGWRQVD